MNRLCLACLAALAAASGCGGGSTGLAAPTVQPAKQYRLGDFTPVGAVSAGKPVTISFHIIQPSGQPLTQFAEGAQLGPHTGVHLILVRDDLSQIIHRHPPIAAGGAISETVTFSAPGPYRLLVDVYAKGSTGVLPYNNFQMTGTIDVSGAYHPQPIGAVRNSVTADGYRFAIHNMPKLRVAQAAFLDVHVSDAAGHPAKFTPWYGALAHAIFFHERDLSYFHTHVCAPNSAGCTGVGAIAGSSSKPGVLHVGVLLPEAGVWRLFLQCRIGGRVVSAPFTLKVAS
ncbi:MAG: hypothetical protein QOG02_336 [Gaiellales bacterium]|jgi:hypothetical protein|nr:hypothetical protein [Gaiellales bacterium]